MISVSTCIEWKTPVNAKLDSIAILTGQDNIRIWNFLISLVFWGIEVYEVVVDGVSPADGADQTETDAFMHFKHTALTIFLQLVSLDILKNID